MTLPLCRQSFVNAMKCRYFSEGHFIYSFRNPSAADVLTNICLQWKECREVREIQGDLDEWNAIRGIWNLKSYYREHFLFWYKNPTISPNISENVVNRGWDSIYDWSRILNYLYSIWKPREINIEMKKKKKGSLPQAVFEGYGAPISTEHPNSVLTGGLETYRVDQMY